MTAWHDAVIVGSGPNGLAAAVTLAQGGASVLVLEAEAEIGGGTRTAELTLPGYRHDVCSAVHPMGLLSPCFRTLDLEAHGLRWVLPPASVAHPLPDEPAVMLRRSMDDTCAGLGDDGPAYRRLLEPFLRNPHGLLGDAMAPLGIPRHPFLLARFGLVGLQSAARLARRNFRGVRARALFAGLAAHAILPLTRLLTGSVGMIFGLTAHVREWPIVAGGSGGIPRALASCFAKPGGEIQTGARVTSLRQLPRARLYLFDTSPNQVAGIAGDVLPRGYLRRLGCYRYGPGAFKIDWALDGPIPWKDPGCLEASTVHLGGTFEEIAESEAAVWRGEHPERPFVLLCQQSQFDPSRAPAGKHTGYAYCHVPGGSTVDMTRAIENQVERFAPGFKDHILARHVLGPAEFERMNPNYVGGAITGGVADILQFFTRPIARINPYTTPNPRILLCSASTPPGGGVHGMCGYHAARTALKRLGRLEPTTLG